jgi:hypothetical protein
VLITRNLQVLLRFAMKSRSDQEWQLSWVAERIKYL